MKKILLLILILTTSISSIYLPISLAEEEVEEYYWDYFLTYNYTFNYEIRYLTLSRNGTLMAIFLGNNSLLVYRNNTIIGRYNAFGDIQIAGFSPSGKLLYFEQEAPRKFVIINLTAEDIKEFEVESKIRVVAFAKNERYVALGGVRESRGSPKNYIYLVDLEKNDIRKISKVVKDVHRILITDENKLISLTTETFCYSCLSAKEKYIKYFNIADGKLLLRVEREKHVLDIFLPDDLSELGVVYTDKIVKYKANFAEHRLEKIKELSTTEIGVFRGFSPDGKYLYYEEESEDQTIVKIVNPELKIVYTKRIRIPKRKSDLRKVFLASNFTILVYHYRNGDPLAKIVVYKQGGLSYQIPVSNRNKKIAFSEDAGKIVVYSRTSMLVYQYMKKKVEKPEEIKYHTLSITVLDHNNNSLDNVNLTIKELGLSIILQNGSWSQIVPEGVYTIITSKEDFFDVMKIINLTSDTHIRIRMRSKIFKLSVKVEDLMGINVANASVVLYKYSGEFLSENITDVDGICSFSVKEGDYELLVVKKDAVVKQVVEVRRNTNITIVLPIEVIKKVKVKLIVQGEEGVEVENYTAYFLNKNGYLVAVYSPLNNGTDGVELLPGKYLVRVKAVGYKGRTIEIEASEEKSYTIVLEKENVVEEEKKDYTFYVLTVIAVIIAIGIVAYLKRKGSIQKKS